ncbi:TIR domain-containing protein [Candidatus Latescibacterota bacterium]
MRNYSNPQHDPDFDPKTEVGKRKLGIELNQQIQFVGSVIVIVDMYRKYEYWIQEEIEIAQEFLKPIIGLKPISHERIPSYIQFAADEIISWETATEVPNTNIMTGT